MKMHPASIGLTIVLVFQGFFLTAQKIVRGPYLNSVTPSSAIIRWRTDKPILSKVKFGVEASVLDKEVNDAKVVTDHEIIVTGLQPATKYFYKIIPTQNDFETNKSQYVTTSPGQNSNNLIRIWALGDFGNSSKNQIDCRDAILKATAGHRPDAWIWLGDNAYSNGKDKEYQEHVFNIYQESFFKNTTLYPSPGNHDYGDHNHSPNIPYFDIFTLPQHGEAGGVPSGSEAYYSVDFGNVHLVSLDSYGELDGGFRLYDTLGKQVTWLKKDLQANKLPWTILYWHHPPYTKGSHDSDNEDQLVKIRENLVPILERYKVDLVLCGHSHVYERTHPMVGHYGLANTFDPKKHIVAESQSPRYNVKNKQQGIIYIVNGSGGQIGGAEDGYPLKSAIYSNNTIGGSLLMDFQGNKMEVRWICSDGVVRDHFSIEK